jgi:hypothetical protein
MDRTLWHSDQVNDPNAPDSSEAGAPDETRRQVATEEEANLVGSWVGSLDYHLPVLDIDRVPIRLVPSSTPGNFHLYIDQPVTWDEFSNLLDALAACRIVEAGYVAACKARKQAFVRLRPDKPAPMPPALAQAVAEHSGEGF